MSWEFIALIVFGYCCFCWYLEYRQALEFIDDPETKKYVSETTLPGESMAGITTVVMMWMVCIAPITKPYWWCRRIPTLFVKMDIWRIQLWMWNRKRKQKTTMRRIRRKLVEVGYSEEQAAMMTDPEAKYFSQPKQPQKDAFEEVYLEKK
ncbi:MAG: hypothetical protein ACXADB_11435 [Candidatus Hermodarchaeia archaeon]|jgi:hypothetical protein